jgi:zinc transporter 2
MKEEKKQVFIELHPINEGIIKGKNEKVEDINDIAKNKLILVCLICFFFMAIEFVGGIMASSLAIMTDAAHLLSDLAGFVISIFALQYAKKAPNNIFTFGYFRAEIVGAFFSVMIIWILTIILLCESIQRLFDTHHRIDGKIMLISASIGLVFNMIMVYILHSDVIRNNKLF